MTATFAQPFEDYEILDRVGGGSMGTVFKARHKRLNRIVALKVLKPSLARDKRYVERLRREARIVASLSHPHIVTGYDLGEEGGYHFFVMEFVEGKSLRQLLTEWGMFAEEYVLRVARQAAEALDHAYQRDVIHRDIKPGNILIDERGDVKLTDMGLAKGPADLTLTRDGATVGTPMYISPEQARNPQDVDVRSDLYSLGATLYHMATGVPPFSGDTMAELITNVLHENIVPPDEANSAVSPGVSLVIRKLLAKNLQVRYQTPRELLDDLDRIERAQPPDVDVGRLESEANDPNRWLRPVFLGAAALLLAVVAWWVGRQMVEPAPREQDADTFLAELDQELRDLASPGARHLLLATIADSPTGTAQPLEARRQQVANELQAALGAVVDEFEGKGFARVEQWLEDPAVWPDLAQFERERLQPRVRAIAGIGLEQLPSRVRLTRIEQLRQAVDRTLVQRDGEFVARFERFLGSVLPGRANDKARRGDFAAADRLWRDALPTFCNGVQQPLPERLSEDARREVRERLDRARDAAERALGQAEQAVVRALRGEVATTLSAMRGRLEQGADPVLVEEALTRFRANLAHDWPPSPSFRLGRDPWPEVDQQLMATAHAVELARAEVRARRFDERCDLAWRLFCHGDARAALAALAENEPATAQQESELELYRRYLMITDEVGQAVLATIAAEQRAPVGFLLGAGVTEPFALRVEPDGERLRLVGEAVDRPPRAMRLTELRIGDLLERLGVGERGPLQSMASQPRALGLAVLRLVADDAAALDRQLGVLSAGDRTFLLERVWPRIQRVRAQPAPDSIDLAELFAALENAVADLDQGGSPNQLEQALLAMRSVETSRLTIKQRKLLRDARARRDLVHRQRGLQQDLSAEAPRGSEARVRVEDAQLVASVSLPAEALRRGAGEGWQLRGDVLEFAGAARPWTEQPQLALRGGAGLAAGLSRTRLDLEIAFPESRVGRRVYLLDFHGVGVALTVLADDSVHAALVDGPVLDEERAQKAFVAAASGIFAQRKSLVVPGSTHRLTVDVHVTSARTQANVVVRFEGAELLKQLWRFDAERAPSFALHPLQEVAVRRATIEARGL